MNTSGSITVTLSGQSALQRQATIAKAYRRVRSERRPVFIADEDGVVRMTPVVEAIPGRQVADALAATAGTFAGTDLERLLHDIRDGRGEEGSALA